MSHIAGKVNWILRVEGGVLCGLALFLYSFMGFSWTTFGVYFLVPDISFLGYLVNMRVGAIAYNCAHSLIGALVVLGFSVGTGNELLQIAGLIWAAHIGFDRALGYGLKYSRGFGYTHLGLIGKHENS